jgi:hypothetical protein
MICGVLKLLLQSIVLGKNRRHLANQPLCKKYQQRKFIFNLYKSKILNNSKIVPFVQPKPISLEL